MTSEQTGGRNGNPAIRASVRVATGTRRALRVLILLVATARARAVAGGGIAGIPKAATKVGTKVGARAAGVGEARAEVDRPVDPPCHVRA